MTPEKTFSAATLMVEYAEAMRAGELFPIERMELWKSAHPNNYYRWEIDDDPGWDWETYNYRKA